MHDISAASAEQTSGLEQINRAVAQIDEATQQNAALVEQAAAAAASMQQQSVALTEVVSIFKLSRAQNAPQHLRSAEREDAAVSGPVHMEALSYA